jgi:hypothetical protein
MRTLRFPIKSVGTSSRVVFYDLGAGSRLRRADRGAGAESARFPDMVGVNARRPL